jgi:glucose-1-phosphate cytidylyltransferase
MKVVILAGGMGSRLSEETIKIPKPMVEIGGKPILWHLMKYYSSYGLNDFIICCGYKGYLIKEYFANYHMHNSDMTINLSTGNVKYKYCTSENWNVTLVDTGIDTLTEERLLKIKQYVDTEAFCLTYGDGLCDVNIPELVGFHLREGKSATVTAIKSQGRFGALKINEDDNVTAFMEKIITEESWINGGFFVFEPKIFQWLKPNAMLEQSVLPMLSQTNDLMAYRHFGNWQCMDTMHDRFVLEDMWNSKKAFWKNW